MVTKVLFLFFLLAEESTKCDRVLGDETPESGNRDEGYSTMSSDVQGTTEQPSTKGLEDVKEANENESNALIESSPCSRYDERYNDASTK